MFLLWITNSLLVRLLLARYSQVLLHTMDKEQGLVTVAGTSYCVELLLCRKEV